MKSLIISALIFSASLSFGPCFGASTSPMDPKWTDESLKAPKGGSPAFPILPPLPGDSSRGMESMSLAPASSEPKLGGVFFSKSVRSFAVLDGHLVGLGDRHGIWTLASVTNIGVTLKSGSREIDLSLFAGNALSSGLQIIDFSTSPDSANVMKSTKPFKK